MSDLDIRNWHESLLSALRSLDVSQLRAHSARYAEAGTWQDASDEAVLIGAHKSRVEFQDLTDAERWESVEWLRERGFQRLDGLPLPTDKLP